MNATRAAARTLAVAALAAILLGCRGPAAGETATIAVASNFNAPFAALARQFAAVGPHRLTMVSGSTGQLYAQILNGAPFDALLAADQTYAARLAAEGHGVASSRFTYAEGRLALFTRAPERFAPLGTATLTRSDFRWLALANPELAPYGRAAKETLVALELWEPLAGRLVQGQNIAQTFTMVETGNADLGLVALAQALAYAGTASYIEIPGTLHAPIRQDAILLTRGAENPAAKAFLAFLAGPEARATIAAFGYGTVSNGAPERVRELGE